MDSMAIIGGIILIGFGFVILISALPSLSVVTDTSQKTWENSTPITKQGVSILNNMLLVVPFIFFLGGMWVIVKGVS